jgi:hypothetical protein
MICNSCLKISIYRTCKKIIYVLQFQVNQFYICYGKEIPMVELSIILSELKGVEIENRLKLLFTDELAANLEKIVFSFQDKKLMRISCIGNILVTSRKPAQSYTLVFTFRRIDNSELFQMDEPNLSLTKSQRFDSEMKKLYSDVKFIAQIKWQKKLPFVSDEIQGTDLKFV